MADEDEPEEPEEDTSVFTSENETPETPDDFSITTTIPSTNEVTTPIDSTLIKELTDSPTKPQSFEENDAKVQEETADKKKEISQETKSEEQLKTLPNDFQAGRKASLELEKKKNDVEQTAISRLRSKENRQCQRRFREMIGKRELKKEELEKQEDDLRHRLDILECSMPAVMVWNIWRMAQGAPVSRLHRIIEKQFQGPASGEVFCPRTPSRHFDCRVREAEAERKIAQKRAEEARSLWTEKEATLEEKQEKVKEARKIQEERKVRIEALTKEVKELKKNLIAGENDGSCETGECGDIKCKERWLEKVSSANSIKSADLECLERLQELAETEVAMKRQINELERREEAYMRTLQQADDLWAKMEGDTGSTVSALQEQLDMKTTANQQMVDRIHQLEDDLENLRNRLANCGKELEKYMSIDKIEAIIGRDDDLAEVADKAALAGVEVRYRKVGTADDEMLVHMDKALLAKAEVAELGMEAVTAMDDKDVSARPDTNDLATDRPDLIKVEHAKLGIRPEDLILEDQKLQEASDYLAQLGSLSELDYDDDYGVCAPDFACNDVVLTETGMDDEELAALGLLEEVGKGKIGERKIDDRLEVDEVAEVPETRKEVGLPMYRKAYGGLKETLDQEEVYRDIEERIEEEDEDVDAATEYEYIDAVEDEEEEIGAVIDEPVTPISGKEIDEEKVIYEDVPEDEEKVVYEDIEDKILTEIPRDEEIEGEPVEAVKPETLAAKAVAARVFGEDDVVLSRKELLLWLDTVNSIRKTVVKCSDCIIVMSDADSLAVDLAAVTGSEMEDVMEDVLPERVELEVEAKVEPAKEVAEGEIPSAEIATDTIETMEKEEEAWAEGEAVMAREIVRTEVTEEPITEEKVVIDYEEKKVDEVKEVEYPTEADVRDFEIAEEEKRRLQDVHREEEAKFEKVEETKLEEVEEVKLPDVEREEVKLEKVEEVQLPDVERDEETELEKVEKEEAKLDEAKEEEAKLEKVKEEEVQLKEPEEEEVQLEKIKEEEAELKKPEEEVQLERIKEEKVEVDDVVEDKEIEPAEVKKEEPVKPDVAEPEEIAKIEEKLILKEEEEIPVEILTEVEPELEEVAAEVKEIPVEEVEEEVDYLLPTEDELKIAKVEEPEEKEPLIKKDQVEEEIPKVVEPIGKEEIPSEVEEVEEPAEEIEVMEKPKEEIVELPPEEEEPLVPEKMEEEEKEVEPVEEIPEPEVIELVEEEIPEVEIKEEIKEEVVPVEEEPKELPEVERLLEEEIIALKIEEEVIEEPEKFPAEPPRLIDPDLVAKPYLTIADIEVEEELPPCICKPVICPMPPEPKKIEITQTETIIHTETTQIITQTVSNIGTQTLPAQRIMKRIEHPPTIITNTMDQESEVPERLSFYKKLLKDQATITTVTTSAQTEKPLGSRGPLYPPSTFHPIRIPRTNRFDQEEEMRSISYRKLHEKPKTDCNCCFCGKVAAQLPKIHRESPSTLKNLPSLTQRKMLCLDCRTKRLEKGSLEIAERSKKVEKSCCDREVCTVMACIQTFSSTKRRVREKKDQSCMAKIAKRKDEVRRKEEDGRKERGLTYDEVRRKEEDRRRDRLRIKEEDRRREGKKSGKEKGLHDGELEKDLFEDCICFDTIENDESGMQKKLNCTCGDSD